MSTIIIQLVCNNKLYIQNICEGDLLNTLYLGLMERCNKAQDTS